MDENNAIERAKAIEKASVIIEKVCVILDAHDITKELRRIEYMGYTEKLHRTELKLFLKGSQMEGDKEAYLNIYDDCSFEILLDKDSDEGRITGTI